MAVKTVIPVVVDQAISGSGGTLATLPDQTMLPWATGISYVLAADMVFSGSFSGIGFDVLLSEIDPVTETVVTVAALYQLNDGVGNFQRGVFSTPGTIYQVSWGMTQDFTVTSGILTVTLVLSA